MSCYHPIAAYPDYDLGRSSTGKYHYKLEGSWSPQIQEVFPDCIRIPCGHCLGCRLDHAREWADRMMYELESYDGKGIFLTLTYSNEKANYVIDQETGEFFGLSLCKRDFQLFLKRLRRHFDPIKISFYAAGEYGKTTSRPHYHAIIFGLSLCDFSDRIKIGYNELGQEYFKSPLLASIWSDPKDGSPIGIHCLSDVSYKTCAYVARYCMKKAFDIDVPEGFTPEFSLMSRRPAIGRRYLEEHPEVFDLTLNYFSDSNGSVKVGVPKYFLYRLKLTNPDEYDRLIERRKELSMDREFLRLSSTSLSYIELNELEENALLNKTKILFKRREEVVQDETSCE